MTCRKISVLFPSQICNNQRCTVQRAQKQSEDAPTPMISTMIVALASLLVLVTLLIYALWKDRL